MYDNFKCDGNKRIAASINIYNEIDCLPFALDSLKDFPVVIVVDGKWKSFNDPKANPQGLSYDGSRELCAKYPNVLLLDCGNQTEEAMSNLCLRTSANLGYDYLLQIAADEYVTCDNYLTFQGNCDAMANGWKDINMFMVKFNVIKITPPSQNYPEVNRLIRNMQFIRLRDIHWIYYFMDTQVKTGLLIKGLTINHDDTPRNQAREDQMQSYQIGNVQREQNLWLHKYLMGLEEKELINMDVLKIYLKDTWGITPNMGWWETKDERVVFTIREQLSPKIKDGIRKTFACDIWNRADGTTNIMPIKNKEREFIKNFETEKLKETLDNIKTEFGK